nr:hypothetical protein [uncultured Desulfuromonas sp.]
MTVLYSVAATLLLLKILCSIKGKLSLASLLTLLESFALSFLTYLILVIALDRKPVTGPELPLLPFAASLITLLTIPLVFFAAKRSSKQINRVQSLLAVFLTAIGGSFFYFGFFIFVFFTFAGWPGYPLTLNSVVILSIGIVTGSIILYWAAKYDGKVYINSYRWSAYWAINTMTLIIFVCTSILLFAYPDKVAQQAWAAIITLNYIPLSLLVVGINQRHVRRSKDGNVVEKEELGEFAIETLNA